MNGMRIKSHKSYYNQNRTNKTSMPVRYTPLGAIRLLPPIPAVPTNIEVIAVPGGSKPKTAAKRGSKSATASARAQTKAKSKTKSRK